MRRPDPDDWNSGGKGGNDNYRDDRNSWGKGGKDKCRDDWYSGCKGKKGGKNDGKGNEKGGKKGWQDGRGEKGEKGDKGDKGKGRGGKSEKVLKEGLRGKVVKIMQDQPTGFIQRDDGDRDVFFSFDSVLDDEQVELYDKVIFDLVEGGRCFAARIKKVARVDNSSLKSSQPLTASAAGSLTCGIASKPGSLTGGLSKFSLRPGGLSLRPGGALGVKKEEKIEDPVLDDDEPENGFEWGRVINTKAGFGFVQPLRGNLSVGDTFFRAADVTSMECEEPGEPGKGIQITLPSGLNSNGYKMFWINVDDEVSYRLSKDLAGKTCAIDIRKERKGAWRTGRRAIVQVRQQETFEDLFDKLMAMLPDQVVHNASLFKDILEHREFAPSHLQPVLSLLATQDLCENDRADVLYRILQDSSAMRSMLRTAIIKHSAGKHSGSFLEDCLRVLVEVVIRHPSPHSLRGQLPLGELVEAWECCLREGSTSTKEGLPEDMISMLKCLRKRFPDEINLNRILGNKGKKQIKTATEDYTELLEADYYQDMPILPTSDEMLGQCAFEITENMRTYEKCEDYLQTHFMLLREDYVEPLRVGMKKFSEGSHSPKDLHHYQGVKVVGMLSTFEGVVYRIELPKEQIRRVNWEKSKQLMYGSLLCFSDDRFDSIIWATVFRRDAELMASHGHLDVRLPFEPFDDRFSPGKSFCCIENVAIYFEAVRHVLMALRNMRPVDVPFQQTMLAPQPETVPPTFLKAENDMWYFHNVFANCEKEESVISAPRCFNILQEWPSMLLQALDIDPSQLDAIQHALTHAVSLIQGPPGTGKTWVGLKIVQALLENTRDVRYSPILVVCFTNHALDQFLEGIFKFCEKVARIGSRSKSEIMKARNLKELVGELRPSKEYYQARKALTDRRQRLRKELQKLLETVDSRTVDLPYIHQSETLNRKQFDLFYQGYLDYLCEDSVKITSKYEDADAVDDELWEKMMKAWLETSHPEKLAPVTAMKAGGLPKADQFKQNDEDDEVDKKNKEIADDAEEDEAEAEQHDRKLDVEQPAEQPDKQPDRASNALEEERRQANADFHAEMTNSWLPYWEEYEEKLSFEMHTFKWEDHIDDLWLLPREKRRETYRQWLLSQHHEAREQLPELAYQIDRNAESRAGLERDKKLELLREMQIVGMTTTAVSKYSSLLKELRPEVVVVEEAAEVLEAHILTALHAATQHVILIGDHQQLRPSTAVYRLSQHFGLDVSLFERLIKNGADHVTLLQQRRMHPQISRLIKPLYPKLRDHRSTEERAEVQGVAKRTYFLTHSNLEDDDGLSHSKSNTFEACYVSALCVHLIQSGYEDSQITVLSPYLGQVRTLKNKMREDSRTSNVLVTAVDNFQGEENDIIVISLVRSNRAKAMGFLAVDNRINVALTRARCGMFIVGNSDMLTRHKLWGSILSELRSDGCFGDSLPLVVGDGIVHARTPTDICRITGYPEDSFGAPANAVAERWAGLGTRDTFDRRGLDHGSPKSMVAPARGSRLSGSSGAAVGASTSGASESRANRRSGVSAPVCPTKMDADGGFAECELIRPKDSMEVEENGVAGKKTGKKKSSKGKLLVKMG